jgi:hypothetical protein
MYDYVDMLTSHLNREAVFFIQQNIAIFFKPNARFRNGYGLNKRLVSYYLLTELYDVYSIICRPLTKYEGDLLEAP